MNVSVQGSGTKCNPVIMIILLKATSNVGSNESGKKEVERVMNNDGRLH